ncbi:uncharacterized protein MCYG_02669 [Microsporum canis CBS 113480]|uniref:BZIP domain-containing protein n=1 Tax=Arthroderma otae (strain ATCC MYA-4605 / CBS 113480) TaxID=554155 RepID=C5FGG5_ARTOC|nr:uncharacterized protein MCYG_02669 [Microsporum canis CBS 113480]EEQ29850.1 hypothetical protein MCYG_02669 [Microsporum canis CBS 113480]
MRKKQMVNRPEFLMEGLSSQTNTQSLPIHSTFVNRLFLLSTIPPNTPTLLFDLFEGRSPLERGKDRPCHVLGQLPFGGDQNLMSQRPYASNSPSDETSQPVSQLLTSPGRSTAPQDEVESVDPQARHGAPIPTPSRSGSVRGDETPPELAHSGRPTSSGHGSASQKRPRSLGMQAILNPSSHAPLEPSSRQSSREPLGSPTSTATSPSAHIRGTPSPIQPPTQPPLHYHYERSTLSPKVGRKLLTPKSPAVRAASLGGRFTPVPGTINAIQSPFLQSPPPPRFAEGASRVLIDSASATVPSRLTQPRQTTHAASIFYDQRPSTNPQSQDTSPRTPQSSYSSYSHPSPAPAPSIHIQQQHPSPISNPAIPGPPRSTIAQSLLPLENRGHYRGDGALAALGPYMTAEPGTGLIPFTIDRDSGSMKAKIKREKNSSASKRFRQRKKVVEAEQSQAIKRQEEEIKSLTEERDFYIRERNFFRDMYARTPGAKIPPRPPSPRSFKPRATPLASEDEGEHTSLDADDGGSGAAGRNVRQRTGSGPVHLPYPGIQTSGSFAPMSRSPSTHAPPAPSYPLPYPAPWRAPPMNINSQTAEGASVAPSPTAQASSRETQQQQASQYPPYQQHQ